MKSEEVKGREEKRESFLITAKWRNLQKAFSTLPKGPRFGIISTRFW
jgi:hypothetical protein